MDSLELKFGTTARGFRIIEFTDRYDYECSLQASSLATEDAIWFGIDDPKPQIMAVHAKGLGIKTNHVSGWIPYPIPDEVNLATRMHLTREQVARLMPLLQHFVDTGELPTGDA